MKRKFWVMSAILCLVSNTAMARFISADPDPVSTNTAVNFNRYAYANNSPYAKYDPSGRESGCITMQTDCVDEAGVVQDLQTIDNNADAFNAAIMGAGLPGAEIGAAEGATVAAVEEVAAAAPAIVEGIGQGFTAATSEVTSLYRAVNTAELADLSAKAGAFSNPVGTEVKYFSETAEGAASYAQQAHSAGGILNEGPYTIVGTQFPSNLITPMMRASPDRGIPTVVVPTQLLPWLTPAEQFVFTPIPQ
jgi:hypothetical protein